jgi:predicted neuraminidase
MNIVERRDGTLWACFRSRWADYIYEAVSKDDGVTWSEPVPTVLPNNNSSIQAAALGDGRTALVFNASSAADATARRASLYDEIDDGGIRNDAGEQQLPARDTGAKASAPISQADRRTAFWGAPRAPMTLALSSDEGRHWPVRVVLEAGDGYCLTNNSRDGLNRELSYPPVLPGPDGDLHIAYTWHRRAIRYVRLPADTIASLSAATNGEPTVR